MSWISEALHLASTYSNNGDFQKSYLTYITLIENLCTKLKGWNIGSNENLTIQDMMFLFQVLNQALENAKTIYCDHNQNAKAISQTQINNPLYPLAHLSNISSTPPVAPPKASSRPRSNSNVVRTLPSSPQASPKNPPSTLLSESEESLRANNLQITETKSSPITRELSKSKDGSRSDKSSFINNIKARFEAHLNSEKTITYSLSKSDSQTGFKVEEVIKTSPVIDHSPDHRLSTDSVKLTVSSLSDYEDDDISSNQDSEHQHGAISTPPQNSSPLNRFSLEDVDLNFLVTPKLLKPLPNNSNIAIPSIPKSPLIVITQTANEKLNLTKMRAVDPSYQNSTTSPDSSPQLFEELSQTFLTATSTLERVSRLRRIERSGTFLSFPPGIIAYQLTLIESELFFRISLEDLLQHSPSSPNPRVTASTDFFNYFTRAIEISILSYSHPTERAIVIHFWIKVALKLHQLLNFQTLKAVLSALGTPPIQRLRKTWNEVNKKDISRLSSLRALMSEDSNYEQYRKATSAYEADLLKLVAYSPSPNPTHLVPILPYMGVFIMDLTYLNAASKRRSTIVSNEPTSALSNSEQRKQDVITKFQAYQYAPRHFPVPPHNFIKTHKKGTSFTSFSFPFGKSNPINNASQSPLPFALAPPLDSLLIPLNEKQNHSALKRPMKDPEMMANMQYMATHLILSQTWAPEKIVDEMSRELEKAGTSDSLTPDTTAHLQPEEESSSRPSESKSRHRRGSSGGFVNPPQFGSILENELYQSTNIARSETEDSEGPLDVSIPNSRISLMLPLQSPSNDRQHY